jgi:hypothetical protein
VSPPTEIQQRVVAAADLVGRSGARGFTIGYLHEDVPATDAAWYAFAQYRGARITAENHRGPAEAAEALAKRLLTGARCACGKLVALSNIGAVAFERATLVDGSQFTLDQAVKGGQCLWQRKGDQWVSACGLPGGSV